jgi:hypothetical protein
VTHPNSLLLEGYACGEPLRPELLAHVEACEACMTFVGELRGLVSTSTAKLPLPLLNANASTDASADVRAKAADAKAKRGRVWVLATSVITPLAAAAAILLLTRSPGPTPIQGPGPGPNAPAMTAPIAPLATGQVGGHTGVEPDTTFKGGTQIAVVRERGGEQTRFSSTVRVMPGDRIRVEVALDHEQAILGAVLADDGTYLELMPEGVRGAGTYFSERSAKIDATPTRGTVVIGTPEAVARARATKQMDGVATLRVEWEGKP